jgi:hypothetical protein
MIMRKLEIHRRSVLRGIGGAVLALPFLEAMLDGQAMAAPIPKRYLVCFAGTSIGRAKNSTSPSVSLLPPAKLGAGYDLPLALAPLATTEFGDVRGHVSVVSNLKLPWGPNDSSIPPRWAGAHLSFVHPQPAALRQSFLNMYELIGHASDLHQLGHGQGAGDPGQLVEGVAHGVAWHVRHFAWMVGRLASLPEADGTSVLDHTAMLLVFEGGHGFDPATGRTNVTHSSENMAVLVAGGAGGLKGGLHVDGAGAHPTRVVLSAMKAVGAGETLGDVTGVIPELF